jgi:hypothetical protein
MKFRLLLPLLLFSVASYLPAQSAPVYAESFRQGATRIVEDHFEVKLTPKDPRYRVRIKDSLAADHYVLSIIPQGPEGDTEITSWLVKLSDLRHTIYDNILLTTQEPSSDPKNALWRLDPSSFARVPLNAQRIIKVDHFYVVLQVKERHFTPPDSPYLDSMTVDVDLTNSDPRTAEGTLK